MARFLAEIDPDGPGPDWVVADGARAIANAVARRWPNATFYSCEFHVGRALKEAARSDGIDPDFAKHAEIFRKALWSNHDWDALRAFASSKPAPVLQGWCQTNDVFVRQQVALHKQFFGFPRSNAAAERILDWIDKRFGRRRRYSLRNAARLQLVLALVRAFHAGQSDLATFASVVKATMRDLHPDSHFAWTARHDPSDRLCSIGQLIVDAHDRAAKGNATYMAAAKARSVIANVASQNQALAEIGAPPMEATIAPGRATASVKVTGKMLAADFPLIARDWDPGANDQDRWRRSRLARTTRRTGSATAAPTTGSPRSVAGRSARRAASDARRNAPTARTRSRRSTRPSSASGTSHATARSVPTGSRPPTPRRWAGSVPTTPSTRPIGCRPSRGPSDRSGAHCVSGGRLRRRRALRPD